MPGSGWRGGWRSRERQIHLSFQNQRDAEHQLRQRAQPVIDETAGVVAEELQDVVIQVGAVRGAAGTIDDRVGDADQVTNQVVAQAAEADRVVFALVDSLRRVAGMAQVIFGVADQTKLHALVAMLDAAVSGAIDRVTSMSSLTQRLERRRAERVAAGGSANLEVNGRVIQAELRDFSILGAQVATPQGEVRRGQTGQLRLALD